MPNAMDSDKLKDLQTLLNIYQAEVLALPAISKTWEMLKDEAQGVCAEDFNKAIEAREELLLELMTVKDADLKAALNELDKSLLGLAKEVKTIYDFDVRAYLNLKQKGLPKP